MALINQGINPITFSNLKLSITSNDSKAINFDEERKVIISASGMCEAGRIRHHLKHNLWKPENTIVFVGYQAYGTLGRALVEGAKEVRLFSETIKVEADVVRLEGMSGHADKKDSLFGRRLLKTSLKNFLSFTERMKPAIALPNTWKVNAAGRRKHRTAEIFLIWPQESGSSELRRKKCRKAGRAREEPMLYLQGCWLQVSA